MKKGNRKNGQVANTKKLFLEAFKKNLGIINPSCAAVNISRSTFYYWMYHDEEFKKACEEVNDIAIEFVENEMFKQIAKGDAKLIIFYLTHKGCNRGYKPPTQEVVITDRVTEFKFPNIELNETNDIDGIIVENLLEPKKPGKPGRPKKEIEDE